jgi:inosose dehydratase
MKRRQFLTHTTLAGAGLMLNSLPAFARDKSTLPVACQQYTWFSYFRREGKAWGEDLDASFQAFLSSGLKGYEPSFQDSTQVSPLKSELTEKDIWTKSMYVNSTLHEAGQWEKSMDGALAIAQQAKKMGVEIVVTNPSPIRWGQPIDKDDAQLKIQAEALDQLGAELRKLGMKLAYHNHDMEMRRSAREFHHMMLATSPENVHLCLDAHWVYRGAGNSQVALFDIVNLYADRIVELHIRQSVNCQKGISAPISCWNRLWRKARLILWMRWRRLGKVWKM